ncbi:hypothetical protein CFC21_081866 [Triticum aestivum]|uniref:Uncharacterized protein n=3 Tax=Triticum aestivum TaxID=4565 RepID=A0A3B6NIC8_WHEAT|nr:hypothetical protein CFC21_081866 [Triticum aestivum]
MRPMMDTSLVKALPFSSAWLPGDRWPETALRLPLLLLLPVTLIILLFFLPSSPPLPPPHPSIPCGAAPADATAGRWVPTPSPPPPPLYNQSCPFHRSSWNCLRNGRPPVAALSWAPSRCGSGAVVPRVDPAAFLAAARGRRIGFVGDSLSENMAIALLCALWSGDPGVRQWKRRGAWQGGHFPREDVVVGYHRAVLLAKYTWQPIENSEPRKDGIKGTYKVDVDIPADDWINITKFYDVLIFNTGHWWGSYKFPKETPLVFYRGGKPIEPPLSIFDGLKIALKSMGSYIKREVPSKTLKLWRTQSPRHFDGGDWNHNGSCVSNRLLQQNELDSWFDPRFGGVNKDARLVNSLLQEALVETDIQLLNLTYMSEFRADAHPAVWLEKKDEAVVWGQDCMHWCLPGVPDTWVDILAARILHYFKQGKG